MFNAWEVGSTIAFLHDIADVTTNVMKTLSESRFKKESAITFVLHMTIWFWTRLIVLPYLIFLIFTQAPRDVFSSGAEIVIPFFCYLLGCMFMLHIYWFSMFVRLLNKYMYQGVVEDEQNKTEFIENKKKSS